MAKIWDFPADRPESISDMLANTNHSRQNGLHVRFNSDTQFSRSHIDVKPSSYIEGDGYTTGIRKCPTCKSSGPFISASGVKYGVCMSCGEIIMDKDYLLRIGARTDFNIEQLRSIVIQMYYACLDAGLINELFPENSKSYFTV